MWIDAPASAVWPWLVQMGRTGVGSTATRRWRTSWIALSQRRSDTPGMAAARSRRSGAARAKGLDGHQGRNRSVRCRCRRARNHRAARGAVRYALDAVWSFHLIPHWEGRCRLVIRSQRDAPPSRHARAGAHRPAKALVTRGMLLGIKRRVQSQSQATTPVAAASVDLHGVS